jgi:hypothetical protein
MSPTTPFLISNKLFGCGEIVQRVTIGSGTIKKQNAIFYNTNCMRR